MYILTSDIGHHSVKLWIFRSSKRGGGISFQLFFWRFPFVRLVKSFFPHFWGWKLLIFESSFGVDCCGNGWRAIFCGCFQTCVFFVNTYPSIDYVPSARIFHTKSTISGGATSHAWFSSLQASLGCLGSGGEKVRHRGLKSSVVHCRPRSWTSKNLLSSNGWLFVSVR